MLTYPQIPESELMARALQAQLRPFGVELSIRSVDGINAVMQSGSDDWHVGLVGTNPPLGYGGSPESFIFNYLVSGGFRNTGPLENAELDALANELAVTVDPGRRTDILHRIQEIVIVEEAYGFPLTSNRRRVVVNDAYRAYQPDFVQIHVSWDTAPDTN